MGTGGGGHCGLGDTAIMCGKCKLGWILILAGVAVGVWAYFSRKVAA